MAHYEVKENSSYGNSIQFNGPVNGNIYHGSALQLGHFYTSYYQRYKNVNPSRTTGTCKWFLGHPFFTQWKDSNHNDILWLSADPGCGKSVLSRTLIDEKLVGEHSATVCYFFFKDNGEQNKVATALCAILHQLFLVKKQFVKDYCEKIYEEFGSGLFNDADKLWSILTTLVTDPAAGTIICVLDALDECEESDRKDIISKFEGFYRLFSKGTALPSKLKFLVTSRPYGDIENGFYGLTQDLPTIRLAGEDESDKISEEIKQVAKVRVNDIATRWAFKDATRLSLHERISQVKNGTYLWLHLVLEELGRKLLAAEVTETTIADFIETLPNTVEDAYEKILERCLENHVARKALNIIVAARRPLTVDEIDVALSIKHTSTHYQDLEYLGDERANSLRNSCGLFITIKDSRVFLIHQTAKEFLTRANDEIARPDKWKSSVDIQQANRILSELCITRLLFSELQNYKGSENYRKALKSVGFPTYRKYTPIPGSRPEDSVYMTLRSELYRRSSTSVGIPVFSRPQQYGYMSNPFMISTKEVQGTIREEFRDQGFLEYSAENWTYHVQEAGPLDSDWVQKTLQLCDIHHVPSSPWLLIYCYKHSWSIPLGDCQSLYWAIRLGLYCETEHLLDRVSKPDVNYGFVQDMFFMALDSERYADRFMAAFLKQPRGHIIISKHILRKVMTLDCVESALALILQQRVHKFEITGKILARIVSREGFGVRVVVLILQQKMHKIKVTEKVVVRAAGNEAYGIEILKLLWDRIPVSQRLFERVACEASTEVVGFFLQQPGCNFRITTEALKGAAGNKYYGADLVEFFLQQSEQNIKVTTEVFEAAMGNKRHGSRIFELLLRLPIRNIHITASMVMSATKNHEWARDIMKTLLAKEGDGVFVAKHPLFKIVMFFGEEMIQPIIQRQEKRFDGIQDIIAAIPHRDLLEPCQEFSDDDWGKVLDILESIKDDTPGSSLSPKDMLRSFNRRISNTMPDWWS